MLSDTIESMEKFLERGFYTTGLVNKTKINTVRNAVDCYEDHQKQGIRAAFSYGGPQHTAPPMVTKALYKKTGIFFLATTACEIGDFQDIWAETYNILNRNDNEIDSGRVIIDCQFHYPKHVSIDKALELFDLYSYSPYELEHRYKEYKEE